jgi:hypothetical protein
MNSQNSRDGKKLLKARKEKAPYGRPEKRMALDSSKATLKSVRQ